MEKPVDHSFPRDLPRPAAGAVLVRKPVGVTSFSLVKAMQAQLDAIPGKAFKVIHGGALDPFAEGLMVMLVGPATRLFERLHEVPKTYVATVKWGAETDTLDAGGVEVHRAPEPKSVSEITAGIPAFLGWKDQVPPATSNKRVDGERAYAKAHRGERFDLPPSKVFLHAASMAADKVTLTLTCGGGFYVRSFVRDLALSIGSAAHLTALNRLSIGPWACPVEGQQVLLTGTQLLPWFASRKVSDDEWARLRKGTRIPDGVLMSPAWKLPSGFPALPNIVRCFHQERLVALSLSNERGLTAETIFQTGL